MGKKPGSQAGPDSWFPLPLPPVSIGDIPNPSAYFLLRKAMFRPLFFSKEKRNIEPHLIPIMKKPRAVTRGNTVGV